MPNLRVISAVLLVLLLAGGLLLYQQLNRTIEGTAPRGPASRKMPHPPATEDEINLVRQRLLDVQLYPRKKLGDTGVAGHIQRLRAGEVDVATLLQYANDLESLARTPAESGVSIPTPFWDVCTQEMRDHQWNEYTAVHALAKPKNSSYIRLLQKSFARFLEFKKAEASGNDTAVDAALDLFALVSDYLESTPPEDLFERPKSIDTPQKHLLFLWQNLVAGTTRTNPLNGKPVFSHSVFSRCTLWQIYQFHTEKRVSVANAWGVSGFSDRFVGTPANNNQIEHMSISMVLQALMKQPVIALNAIEKEKLLKGQADRAETDADIALNLAVKSEFVRHFSADWNLAVAKFRKTLKSD